MIEFILSFERCLNSWTKSEKRDFPSLAKETSKGTDYVIDVVSNALNNEFEYSSQLNRDDAVKALQVLKDRMKPQLIARQRMLQIKRDKAIRAYELTMEKVRVLSGQKNWHSAYRTMTNFIGSHERDLPVEVLLSLLNDAIRIAVKSGENLQELSRWLRKAVEIAIEQGTRESVHEAIDFVDAFSSHLRQDASGNGMKLLNSMTQRLQIPAAQYDLVQEYTALIRDLGMIDSWG